MVCAGVSQRDVTQFFAGLPEQLEGILAAIEDFHEEHLEGAFPEPDCKQKVAGSLLVCKV